ncbi:hypothetical protein BJ085DRAFT_30047 [Dimargaris cristalligena]|uniref:Uncharacterized protein n=1 Tax=Dimargaris cristalligena TaxID=215637 RepID=A0A4P9ZPK3_9FUNG|nr:hypothetical protein BJ085DRAFT_30047 [Dimargaris cristalligena]|eukprot:RKP35247.1 hypothetical protein BJ085DRAFT_30047 [Dimargaris cristalligena]
MATRDVFYNLSDPLRAESIPILPESPLRPVFSTPSSTGYSISWSNYPPSPILHTSEAVQGLGNPLSSPTDHYTASMLGGQALYTPINEAQQGRSLPRFISNPPETRQTLVTPPVSSPVQSLSDDGDDRFGSADRVDTDDSDGEDQQVPTNDGK